MRIAAVLHFYLPDHRAGAELMLHSMLTALVNAGHDVDVLASRETGTPFDLDGVHVYPGGIQRLKSQSYDLAITHLMEAPRVAAWSRATGKPAILVVHNTSRQTDRDLTYPWAVTVFNTNWIRDHYNQPGLVVHPPVDPARFATTPGTMIGLVNMIPEKGSETFYELARRLPQYRFLAVEGGYQQMNQVRINLPNVAWQPNTSNMRDDVYSRLRVLLVPSSYESYGLVGIEAAASGIPVIAHPTPGLRESLGPHALFKDRDNVDAWARALVELMDDNPTWERHHDSALARARQIEQERQQETEAWVDAVTSLSP